MSGETGSYARTALVTGASGSVGFAIARSLLDDGWTVTALSRTRNHRLEELVKSGAIWLQLDLKGTPLELSSNARSSSVLVNSAGVLLSKDLTHQTSLEEVNETLSVNLIAPFELCTQVLPFMIDQQWGRIVNIGSIYSLRGTTRNSAYNMSKHGLSGLTRTIAKEYAREGITCNEVCPAAVESDLMRGLAEDREEQGGMTAEEYLAAVAEAIPSGRMPRPDEIASLVSYLISESAAMVNGASIPVDGGLIC